MEIGLMMVLALVLTSIIMDTVLRRIREKERIDAKLRSAGLTRKKRWDWTRLCGGKPA